MSSTKSCTKPGADGYHIGENVDQKAYIVYNLGDCNDNNPAIYQVLTHYQKDRKGIVGKVVVE
ncbi:MAG: hypothetical protein MUF42_13920 [Cytophagaceae bacterium]|nr:hypothetical protein [Cytophagaceae bacterium]